MIKLTSSQLRDVCYGMLLGDAFCEVSGSGNSNIAFVHKIAHAEYARWKAGLLEELNQGPLKRDYWKDRKTKEIVEVRYRTRYMEYFKKMRKLWYPKGIKTIPRSEVMKIKTPLALAIWYMDDGNLHVRNKCRPYIRICTMGFRYVELQYLVDMLKENFNIQAYIYRDGYKRTRDGNGDWIKHFDKPLFGIRLNPTETGKFIKIVEPYIHDVMKYKIRRNDERYPDTIFDKY